jgi:pyruvate dehydrogenase E1 component
VERALEPWSFGIYAGGQSILVGTLSGVTSAPEGGAHQSTTAPSIGVEQPGCVTYEPAFAVDAEWCLLARAGADAHHRSHGARSCRRRWPQPTGFPSWAPPPTSYASRARALLFRALRAWQGLSEGKTWILDQAFPAARAAPLVTVLDGHPHTLAFLATVNHVPHAALGVAQFGQSGSIQDLYQYNGIDTDSIIRAALDLIP